VQENVARQFTATTEASAKTLADNFVKTFHGMTPQQQAALAGIVDSGVIP